jgi:hypothetical protein
MNKRCRGLFGLIFGHKFKPRYNTASVDSHVHHPPSTAEDLERLIDAAPIGEEMEALDTFERMLRNGNDVTEKQYVCDVCVRCGEVIRL